MAHLALRPKTDLSSFRRMAIGTWRTVGDPSVYGAMDLEMDEALRYVSEYRRATGRRLTVTHLVAKAVGMVLAANPDANALIRFNRLYLRDQVKVFFQVAITDPETGEVDLSGAAVEDPQDKPLSVVLDEFDGRVSRVRRYEDEHLENTRRSFRRIPYLLLNTVLRLLGTLLYTFNLDLSRFGLPKDPFGSVMITNVGALGLDEAYVPLVPYSRVPLLLALGRVREVPRVREGALTVGQSLRLCATFDHRVLDGAHMARMARALKAIVERPFEHLDPIPEAADAPVAAAGD